MHTPDTDAGYFKIANTMLPVLMDAPIRREAKFVLLEVIAQCWGRAKARTANLDIAAIASRWGLDRSNTWRGFRQLKIDGVLIEHGAKTTVKIDKRALVKLLPAEVARGLEAFGEVAANQCPTGHGGSVPQDLTSVPQDTVSVSPRTRNSVPQDTLSAAPQTPLLGRRLEDLKTTAAADDDLEPFESRPIPFKPTPPAPGIQNDPAEVQRVKVLAEKIASMSGLDDAVGRWADTYPIAWIERACQSAAEADKPKRYGLKLLQDWQAAGGPPKPRPDPYAARPPVKVTWADDDDEPYVMPRMKGIDPSKAIAGNLGSCLPRFGTN